MTEYCFVVDNCGKRLAPTKLNKAWYLIRKQRAILISKYPMVIQLKKEIHDDPEDNDHFVCGIDDGSKHVGIAIVQKCENRNKVVFKGVLEHRQDVKKLMSERKTYRKYRRSHKRYRADRFNNRASSKATGRLMPTIKQKRQAVLRVVNQLCKWIDIKEFWLEDVSIDVRAIEDGYKPYPWEYKKSNRLDENIRKAVILRDGNKCMECGAMNVMLEVHHIKAKKYGGSDSLGNLISLCRICHKKTEGREREFEEKYFQLICGKNVRLDYAQHVMQGKYYLRSGLSNFGMLYLTNGGETANKRIDWGANKSHANDAIVITGLKPDTYNIKEWVIRPKRKKSMIKQNSKISFLHGDIVRYVNRSKKVVYGKITAMRKSNCFCKIIDFKGNEIGPISPKSLKLVWRFNNIYFIGWGDVALDVDKDREVV